MQLGTRTTTLKSKTFSREYVFPRSFSLTVLSVFQNLKQIISLLILLSEKGGQVQPPSYSHVDSGKLPVGHLKNNTVEFYLWGPGLTVPSVFSCLLLGSRDKRQPLTSAL